MPSVNYLWDPVEDNVIAEFDDAGNLLVDYTTEPDLYGNVISQHRDGETNVFYSDTLGSTIAVTDQAGNVVATRAYSAFGDTTESTGSLVFPFQYVGQKGYYFDSERNEYYIRRRTYEPSIARWLSIDPLDLLDGSKWYLYGNNSPLNRVDPSGNAPFGSQPGLDPAGKQCCNEEKSILDFRAQIWQSKYEDTMRAKMEKCEEYYKKHNPGKKATELQIAKYCGLWSRYSPYNEMINTKTGHVWLRLKGICGEFASGHHDIGPKDKKDNPLSHTSEGEVERQRHLDLYTHYIRFEICPETCECLKKEIAAIRKVPGIYCVLDPWDKLDDSERHCVTFALEVLGKCGFDVNLKGILPDKYVQPFDCLRFPGICKKPEKPETK